MKQKCSQKRQYWKKREKEKKMKEKKRGERGCQDDAELSLEKMRDQLVNVYLQVIHHAHDVENKKFGKYHHDKLLLSIDIDIW